MDRVAARVNSQGELPPVATRGRPGNVGQLDQSTDAASGGQSAPPRPPRSFRIATSGATDARRPTGGQFPEHLARSVDIDHDGVRDMNRSPTRADDPQTPSAHPPVQYFDASASGSPSGGGAGGTPSSPPLRGTDQRRISQPQASRSPPQRPRSGQADDARPMQARARANTHGTPPAFVGAASGGYEDGSPRIDAASPAPVTPGAAVTPSAQQQQYFPMSSSLGDGVTSGGVSPTSGGGHSPQVQQQQQAQYHQQQALSGQQSQQGQSPSPQQQQGGQGGQQQQQQAGQGQGQGQGLLQAGQFSQSLAPLPPMSSFSEPPPVGAATHTAGGVVAAPPTSTALPPVCEPADSELPVMFGPTKDGMPAWPKDSWSEVMVGTKVTLVLGKTAAWNKSVVKMRIDRRPFAKGNIRFANHALQYAVDENGRCGPPEHVVVKRPLTGVARSKDLWDDVETQTVSAHWAEMYNSHRPPKRISFLPCWMLRIDCRDYDAAMAGTAARSQRSGKILFACEPFLPGEYVKHSNNNGWLNEAVRNTPHAFSHFTWHFSKGMLLIVDIQGVNDYYTDPQIHTPDGKGYGVGNLGYRGIEEFFLTHHCNALCKRLNLNIVQMGGPDAVGATDWTVADGSVAAGSRNAKPSRHVAEGADGAAAPANPEDDAAIERVV